MLLRRKSVIITTKIEFFKSFIGINVAVMDEQEKILDNQLTDYLEINKLLSSDQFGRRDTNTFDAIMNFEKSTSNSF